MKLVRYGARGQERPGLLDPQGRIRDLSLFCRDFDPGCLSPAALKALRDAVNIERLPVVEGKPRLGVPYTGMSKFIAVGLN